MDWTGKVGFAIGTGRCGTLFLHQLLAMEPAVASSHERDRDNETFHRYCKWHGLPVDDEGFLAAKEKEIRGDLSNRAFSFEASPYLSLSVKELHERFGAKFVLLVRCPDGVVTSFVHKGFYRRPYAVRDASLATGYQSPEPFYAFLARLAPRGEAFQAWNAMTPVGKVAWFWKAVNERTIELFAQLPKEAWRLVRIEDLDYPKYLELGDFLGLHSQVSQADFDALRASKPHSFERKRDVDEWSEQEVAEFESQVGHLAAHLGYEYRIADRVDEIRARKAAGKGVASRSAARAAPRLWRVRRMAAEWLRGLAGAVDAS